MKTTKKALSVLLSLLMMFSVFGALTLTANATTIFIRVETENDVKETGVPAMTIRKSFIAQLGENTGDNICKWDNVDHGTSFWGRIVKFFHFIARFFAYLFGRRKTPEAGSCRSAAAFRGMRSGLFHQYIAICI